MKHITPLVTALLLATGALTVSAQELDPSETLQARNLASQAAQADAAQGRSRVAVVAEVHNLQASGQLQRVGEQAEAPVTASSEQHLAQGQKTRAQVRAELAQWQATHKTVVGDRAGEPSLFGDTPSETVAAAPAPAVARAATAPQAQLADSAKGAAQAH